MEKHSIWSYSGKRSPSSPRPLWICPRSSLSCYWWARTAAAPFNITVRDAILWIILITENCREVPATTDINRQFTDIYRQILFTDSRQEILKHIDKNRQILIIDKYRQQDRQMPTNYNRQNNNKYYLETTDKNFLSTPTKYWQILITATNTDKRMDNADCLQPTTYQKILITECVVLYRPTNPCRQPDDADCAWTVGIDITLSPLSCQYYAVSYTHLTLPTKRIV